LTDRLSRRRDEAFTLAEENARLYSEQRQIAETLQRSLLPQLLPTPPGTMVSARYWPAGIASQVGGDFYDLFPLDESRWGLVIGDVCGKGIEAAALTGLVRHTIRAAARHTDSPAEVLQWVHQAVVAYDPSTFCTACYGVLSLRSDGGPLQFEFALGGHAQPLIASADGSVGPVGTSGSLLGMVVDPVITDVAVDLRPGDMLFLYTDGLTDTAPSRAVDVAELEKLVSDGRDDGPDAVASAIEAAMNGRRPVASGDDTALLIVKVL
jgi:serine phosphatase RsbU (regulator of sigma subunit)